MQTADSTIERFREAGIGNPLFLEEIRQAQTVEDLLRIGRVYGFNTTKEEIEAGIKAMQCEPLGLTEEELEIVAINRNTNTATCANSCGCSSTETCRTERCR